MTRKYSKAILLFVLLFTFQEFFANNKPKPIQLDLGGEFFAQQSLQNNESLIGLAAIMVDVDLYLNEKLTGFAAFHFDSSPWHSFLNRSYNYNETDEYDISLHVEEFHMQWQATKIISLKVGRRYAGISAVNAMHLADFDFSTKPRIFTMYYGDNHGLAIDGLSLKLEQSFGNSNISLENEWGKNSIHRNTGQLSSTLRYQYENDKNIIDARIYGYFDYQNAPENKLLNLFDAADYYSLQPSNAFEMNAKGASLSYNYILSDQKNLLLHAELMTREIGKKSYMGGFAYLQAQFSEKWNASIMYQELKVPFFENSLLNAYTERITTLGISYEPNENQRIRLEYSNTNNNPFYDNMLLLKYRVYVNI